MCIISGRTRDITDTEILVFPTQDLAHQVTVYSNKVELFTPPTITLAPPAQPWWRKLTARGKPSTAQPTPAASAPEPVAMILPFPEGECEMIDTTGCDKLFQTLDQWFPEPKSSVESFGPQARSAYQSRKAPLLEVKRCGSYQYSVVPTLVDFDRIDEGVFKLDENVAALLASQYSTDYSFLVCIIDKSAKYQPIAYKHPLRTSPKGGHELFIPTRHEHGNGRADWDHAVYAIGCRDFGRTAEGDCKDLGRKLPWAIGQHVPAGVTDELFHKKVMRGRHPNEDLVLLLPAVPAAA